MKALAVNGSPRRGGNTELLLKKVLEPLRDAGWETELAQIGGKAIHGCTACMKCSENKNGRCIIDGDPVNELLPKMYEADAIILGSPTYFADITAEMKAFIDRSGFVALANNCAFCGKIGAAVIAVRRGGAVHAFDSINHMFAISSMIIPGSRYWNFGVGCLKGEVLNDEEGLSNMQHLGKAIAWLGKAVSEAAAIESYPKVEVDLK